MALRWTALLRSALLRPALRWCALVGALACLAGCGVPAPAAPAPEPVWAEVRLPAPAEAVTLGDLVRCADRWYAVGALRDAADATAPAAWSSYDGRRWEALPIVPASFWGRQQVLYSVACRDDGVAALGAKNGGVHGNPRVSSWHAVGGGPLTEVTAPFELYGGPRAITVTAIAARTSGWLITGNWVGPSELATAAVWRSADAARFVLDADAVGLASSPRGDSTARGVVAGPGDWFVFGDVRPPDSVGRQPAVWGSTGGRVWARAALPAASADGSVTALSVRDERMVAMGTLDGAPHAWAYDGSRWSEAGGLPATDRPGAPPPRPSDVTLGAADCYAAIDDGDRWAVWRSADLRAWRPVTVPAAPPSATGNRLLLAGSDDLLVLAESVDAGSRLWVAPRAAR